MHKLNSAFDVAQGVVQKVGHVVKQNENFLMGLLYAEIVLWFA